MAIQVGVNPIVLDGTTQAITEKLFVKTIHWSGATTANHVCQLNTVSGGSLVFYSKLASYISAVDIIVPVNSWIDSIYVTTLDSGKVFIYHD